MPNSPPPYPPELPHRLVKMARAGRSRAELAREFEPSDPCIRTWVKQADRDAGKRQHGLTTGEKEELTRLRREVRALRDERAILAKAAAWSVGETGKSPPGSSSS